MQADGPLSIAEPEHMRRLRHQQRVEIHLDGDELEVVPCVVQGVECSVASLSSVDPTPVPLLGSSMQAVPGYLVFEHGGRRVALKGIATTAGERQWPEFLFVVMDGVQLPERRAAERVEVHAVARLFPPDAGGDGEPVDTLLADLSISGMRVARHPRLVEGPRYRLELYVADRPTPLRCDAAVARTTATHVGMKFIDVQEADRTLLAAIVASRRTCLEAA
jgi:PilZ domain